MNWTENKSDIKYMLNQLIISVACVFNFLTVAEKLCGDRLTLLLLSIYSKQGCLSY